MGGVTNGEMKMASQGGGRECFFLFCRLSDFLVTNTDEQLWPPQADGPCRSPRQREPALEARPGSGGYTIQGVW